MTVRWSEYCLRRRVHFYEVDSAGVVHFSNYFRYMEEAEQAMWREAGVQVHPPGGRLAYLRVAATCEYQRPLYFEDEFEVHVRVSAIADKSIRYECLFTKEGAPVATGGITVVCAAPGAEGRMRAVSIPADVKARFDVWRARMPRET